MTVPDALSHRADHDLEGVVPEKTLLPDSVFSRDFRKDRDHDWSASTETLAARETTAELPSSDRPPIHIPSKSLLLDDMLRQLVEELHDVHMHGNDPTLQHVVYCRDKDPEKIEGI